MSPPSRPVRVIRRRPLDVAVAEDVEDVEDVPGVEDLAGVEDVEDVPGVEDVDAQAVPGDEDAAAADEDGPVEPGAEVRLATAVGAAAVVGTSAGHGGVAVVLLLVAAGPWVAATAGLAVAATVARWGTADLGAVAGDQAVLGAAITTGPPLAIASSALAAASLVLVARRRDAGLLGWAPAAALGIGAAALAAGPSPVSAADLGTRLGASLAGVTAAGAVSIVVGSRPGLDARLSVVGAAGAATAIALAVVA